MNTYRRSVLAALAFAVVCAPAGADELPELVIDGSRVVGAIRPLHGINCGPLTGGGTLDLSPHYRRITPPLTRLHDCHWPNSDVVDIHVVFPDFRADPTLPESYDFARTDDYIRSIVDVGSGVVFRLGESIEHGRIKRHVHPPKDPAKWAQVCVGIIRHYNEGWADGFRYKIRYWEIWNEPENRPAMWSGTDEDYFRLYRAAAQAIKQRFPDVLVGGPAVGNTGRLEGDELVPSAFLRRFLDYCRRESLPLNFFSWHVYTNDPLAVVRRARAIRRLLDRAGFPKAESHLNEWNHLPDNDWRPMMSQDGVRRQRWHEAIGGPAGAAFAAAVLLLLQDAPLDAANYYAGDTLGFGLFNDYGVPKKSFQAFVAFKSLTDTPKRLPIRGDLPGGLAACAGVNSDRNAITILLSKFSGPDSRLAIAPTKLPWKGPTHYELLVVDEQRNLTLVRSGKWADACRLVENLHAPSVSLLKLRPDHRPARGSPAAIRPR